MPSKVRSNIKGQTLHSSTLANYAHREGHQGAHPRAAFRHPPRSFSSTTTCHSPATARTQAAQHTPTAKTLTPRHHQIHQPSGSALVLCHGLSNSTAARHRNRDNREKNTQYFILRKILYLFPTCSQNVPTLFPKHSGASSALFIRVSRFFGFQKTLCSHVPKKNQLLT